MSWFLWLAYALWCDRKAAVRRRNFERIWKLMIEGQYVVLHGTDYELGRFYDEMQGVRRWA